jgi:hypothetical protein
MIRMRRGYGIARPGPVAAPTSRSLRSDRLTVRVVFGTVDDGAATDEGQEEAPMQRTRVTTRGMIAVIGATALLAACGGGSELGDSLFDQVEDADVVVGDAVEGDGDVGFGETVPGALAAGPVTVFTEPGHAVVTVDGRTIDHTADESGGAFRCTFADEQINLEVRSEFGSMTLTATRTADGWIGRFTADSDEGDDDDWIQYSAQPFDGELGIDADANTLSYVGTAQRQDRIAMSEGELDTPTMDVTVAVNCASAPATLEVGGETLTFALLAADSMTCQVSAPDSIDITINYLATENRQLQFDLRPDGDGVIGGVHVTEGDDRWSSVISTRGGTADGLSFDGSTVTYTGIFEHTSDSDPDLSEEIEGTAVVTCPT